METEAPEAKYSDDPKGWARRWSVELKAAEEATKPWRTDGLEAVQRFRDEGRSGDAKRERRWNLFFAGVATQQALLFGQIPKVGVERRFGDAWDDTARV